MTTGRRAGLLAMAVAFAAATLPAAAQAPRDTMAALDAAILADPNDYDLYQRRAALHFDAGEYPGVALDLEKSIAANPVSRFTPEEAARYPTQTREHDLIRELQSDVGWIREICENYIGRRNPCPVNLEDLKPFDAIIAAAQVEGD